MPANLKTMVELISTIEATISSTRPTLLSKFRTSLKEALNSSRSITDILSGPPSTAAVIPAIKSTLLYLLQEDHEFINIYPNLLEAVLDLFIPENQDDDNEISQVTERMTCMNTPSSTTTYLRTEHLKMKKPRDPRQPAQDHMRSIQNTNRDERERAEAKARINERIAKQTKIEIPYKDIVSIHNTLSEKGLFHNYPADTFRCNGLCLTCQTYGRAIPLTRCSEIKSFHNKANPCHPSGYFPHVTKGMWATPVLRNAHDRKSTFISQTDEPIPVSFAQEVGPSIQQTLVEHGVSLFELLKPIEVEGSERPESPIYRPISPDFDSHVNSPPKRPGTEMDTEATVSKRMPPTIGAAEIY